MNTKDLPRIAVGVFLVCASLYALYVSAHWIVLVTARIASFSGVAFVGDWFGVECAKIIVSIAVIIFAVLLILRKPAQPFPTRDLIRIGVATLIGAIGAGLFLTAFYNLFSVSVSDGPYNVISLRSRPEQVLGAFGKFISGIATIATAIGILSQRARGSCAIVCAAGVFIESLLIYDAPRSDYFAEIMPNLMTYAGVFLIGLVYLLWPKRRTILTGEPVDRPSELNESNWREWLIASLRDTGVEAPPDRFWLAALAFIGFLVITVPAILIGEYVIPAVPFLMVFWILFAIAVLSRLRNMFIRRMWQARARSADQELQYSGGRHPVLYLRSFALDEQLAVPTWIERFLGLAPLANYEQVLTKQLHICGPVIAIGRPGEGLPALGAARFYVTDARWKEKVSDIVRVAELVVWATGTTEGLRWEIAHLLGALPPEKLVLWLHPQLLRTNTDNREAEWTRFCETLGKLFPQPLPEKLGHARFIYFTDRHKPVVVPPAGQSAPLKDTLHTLLIDKGYPKPDPRPRRRRQIAGILALAVTLATIATVSLAMLLHAQKLQQEQDARAWNDLADYGFGSGIYSSEQLDHPDQISANMQKAPARIEEHLSPNMRRLFAPIADDYVAIFSAARAHPKVEWILYHPYQSLVVGSATPEEAKMLVAELSSVLAALETFLAEWSKLRAALPKTGPDYNMADFDKRLQACRQLLVSEIALIQFLVDHPDGWKLAEIRPNVQLPTYADQALQNDFLKHLDVRIAAAKGVKDLLPK